MVGRMRFAFLYSTAAVLLCAGPVFAQGKIVVKNPDGTTQEIELPGYSTGGGQQAEQPPAKPEPKVHVFTAPDKPSYVEPAQDPKPVSKPKVKKASAAKPAVPPKPKRPATKSHVPPKPESPGRVVQQPQPMDISPDQPITEKLAKRIALRIAPPSKDIDVFARTFDGKDVYLVRFKTDDGLFDVLVDMASGDILATKKGNDI